MAEGDGKTVLVTGGTGFLGGWCVVELLRRGYRVRTTVRDRAREPAVRAAIAPQVDPGDMLSFHAGAAEGPRRADRAGPRGDAAGAAAGSGRGSRARRRHLLRGRGPRRRQP